MFSSAQHRALIQCEDATTVTKFNVHSLKTPIGESWTWQLRSEAMKVWRAKIDTEVHRPVGRRRILNGVDIDAEGLLDKIYALPGFRGIRSQVGELVHYLVVEFGRHRKDVTKPKPRPFLAYVRRLPNKMTKADEVAMTL